MTRQPTEQQKRKAIIRSFIRQHYTDERLAEVLAHAQDGKLSFYSCCCFIGCATSDHALRGYQGHILTPTAEHYRNARQLAGSGAPETAYSNLVSHSFFPQDEERESADITRQRILVAIIRAEQRRRERVRLAAAITEEAVAC